MSIIFSQALCHSFSGNHTCLAVDSVNKLIAIGYKNGQIVVYPLLCSLLSGLLYFGLHVCLRHSVVSIDFVCNFVLPLH